jgi:cytochrome c biogenesis protein CcdA
MLRRVGVAISVGLADSLNPSTVGPALYLATVRNRVWRVTQFTIGVFGVTFAGGLVLTIGPGRLLLGLVPHPQGTVRHVIELVAGVVLLIVAVALWLGRRSLARHELPGRSGGGGSALIAGASIAAVELPTAAPYFAVIAGIVASSASVPQQIGLLALYNVAFVLPLLVIVVVIVFGGERADRWLQRGGAWLQRRWPVVLAGLLLFVGSVLAVLGGTGLVRQ